jgi:hypothetical protein
MGKLATPGGGAGLPPRPPTGEMGRDLDQALSQIEDRDAPLTSTREFFEGLENRMPEEKKPKLLVEYAKRMAWNVLEGAIKFNSDWRFGMGQFALHSLGVLPDEINTPLLAARVSMNSYKFLADTIDNWGREDPLSGKRIEELKEIIKNENVDPRTLLLSEKEKLGLALTRVMKINANRITDLDALAEDYKNNKMPPAEKENYEAFSNVLSIIQSTASPQEKLAALENLKSTAWKKVKGGALTAATGALFTYQLLSFVIPYTRSLLWLVWPKTYGDIETQAAVALANTAADHLFPVGQAVAQAAPAIGKGVVTAADKIPIEQVLQKSGPLSDNPLVNFAGNTGIRAAAKGYEKYVELDRYADTLVWKTIQAITGYDHPDSASFFLTQAARQGGEAALGMGEEAAAMVAPSQLSRVIQSDWPVGYGSTADDTLQDYAEAMGLWGLWKAGKVTFAPLAMVMVMAGAMGAVFRG